jgi:hypothetical protein
VTKQGGRVRVDEDDGWVDEDWGEAPIITWQEYLAKLED